MEDTAREEEREPEVREDADGSLAGCREPPSASATETTTTDVAARKGALATGHLVNEVREAVDQIRHDVMEKTAEMKEAFNRGRGRVFHAITANNRIVQFQIGENGKHIMKRTIKTINLQKDQLKEAQQKLIQAGKQVPEQAQKRMRKVITGDPNKRIRDHMKEVPQVKMLDKVSFTMGVIVIMFTEFLILRHPDWFTVFYHWFMLLLFGLRFYLYKSMKYHLFMLDFCYLVNLSCIVQSAFYPDDLTWFNANFALSMGPLCTAIILWHNSLVFHSLDKLTSFFIHAFPPVLYHLYRWRLVPTKVIRLDMTASLWDIYAPSMGIYFVWQVVYIFMTDVVYKEELASDPELITSMRYLVRDRRNPMNKLVTHFCRRCGLVGPDEFLDPEHLRTKAIFVLTQIAYTVVALLPAYFVYKDYYVSCVYIIGVFIWGAWNGASYYIEVFSKRYNLKFEEKKDDDAQSVASGSDVNRDVDADSNGGDSDMVRSSEGVNGGKTEEDDEEEEVFAEALEDMDESQRMELLKILQGLELDGQSSGKEDDEEAGSTS